MKNIFDVMREATEFILGSEPTEVEVVEKNKIGFAPVPDRKKRKYTKKKTA